MDNSVMDNSAAFKWMIRVLTVSNESINDNFEILRISISSIYYPEKRYCK